MDVRKISDELSVSSQITPADVARIRKLGFRSIIGNRPDGESADQPTFAEIETAAHKEALEIRFIPVVASKVGDEDIETFGAALDALPGPVLAYCRTGTRSAMLWSLSEGARGRPLADILQATNAAGYDMSGVVRRIADKVK